MSLRLMDWRRFPSLTALRAFDATARHGGFAGAARALNVTHAAVAQQVRALEAELGLPLAIRAGRSVMLTEEGARLARALDEGFGAIRACITAMGREAAKRPLRITATPYFVDRIIMPNLIGFWNAHPGTEISLHPTHARLDVIRDGFDCAIRVQPVNMAVEEPGTRASILGRVPGLAAAAPAVAARGRDDPHAVPWLWHDNMETKLTIMRAIGLDTDRLEQVPIGSANLLLEAARQGLGAALFTVKIAEPDIAAGRLVEIPISAPLEVDYHAVVPLGPRHRLTETFVDWVRGLI